MKNLRTLDSEASATDSKIQLGCNNFTDGILILKIKRWHSLSRRDIISVRKRTNKGFLSRRDYT